MTLFCCSCCFALTFRRSAVHTLKPFCQLSLALSDASSFSSFVRSLMSRTKSLICSPFPHSVQCFRPRKKLGVRQRTTNRKSRGEREREREEMHKHIHLSSEIIVVVVVVGREKNVLTHVEGTSCGLACALVPPTPLGSRGPPVVRH